MSKPLLPLDVRKARARRLCHRLSAIIAERCPPGLGHSEDVWRSVAGATDTFLDMVHKWEEGTFTDPELLRPSYDALLEAWRQAARRWEERRRDLLDAG